MPADFIKLFLITLPILIVADLLWIGVLAKSFYHNQMGKSLKSDVNWLSAGLFYLVFSFGLVFFVTGPSFEVLDTKMLLLNGLVFGVAAYSTYQLTSLSVMKDWTWKLAIVDIAWGTLMTVGVSAATFYLAGLI